MKNSHLLLISPGLTALHHDLGAYLAPGRTTRFQARTQARTQVRAQVKELPQPKRQTQVLLQPRPSIDPEMLNAYMLRGRKLRSQAIHQALRWLAGWFKRGFGLAATALRRVFRSFHSGRQRRAALRELQSLNDHTLRDLGLSRAEIRTVVDELFRLRKHESDSAPDTRLPIIQELGHVFGTVDNGAAPACNDPAPVKAAEA
ncbi:MAG: DUF1127 domain-containing protein [Gammaproteobacteria bacterium]